MENSKLKIELSEKLEKLPPYLFVEIDKAKREAVEAGRDLIDFGIGDPDQPTPKFIIEALYQAAQDPTNHRYALDQGLLSLREAISRWYKRRFNVDLNPESAILPLIGSKEGIAHLPLAILNEGDYTLVPDPGYPPYKGGTLLAGGRPYSMPLLAKNEFLPDLKKIRPTILKKAKIIFVNYPNNPTSAIATDEFYRELIDFSLKNNIIIASDLAYSEISFDGYKVRSLLEFEGARDCVIEFHSLSKTFNMTGWRLGFACGNSQLISLLAKVKSNIDSGIFSAIQVTGIAALDSYEEHINNMRALYQERRNTLLIGFKSLGWKAYYPKATFYTWVKIPRDQDSSGFAKLLLAKADIVVTPGVGFGKFGEGYIRFALTVGKDRIHEAIDRIKKV